MEIENFTSLCHDNFEALFSKAKRVNEIQFFTSLFAFRKHEDYVHFSYVIDYELMEIIDLIKTLNGVLEIDDIDKKTKSRIALLVYCHIIEVDFIYMVIFNLLSTILREDYKTLITL